MGIGLDVATSPSPGGPGVRRERGPGGEEPPEFFLLDCGL
jgi:hypothetical protein